MTEEQRLKIKLARLSGEFVGTLESILFWEIPEALKERLKAHAIKIRQEYYEK